MIKEKKWKGYCYKQCFFRLERENGEYTEKYIVWEFGDYSFIFKFIRNCFCDLQFFGCCLFVLFVFIQSMGFCLINFGFFMFVEGIGSFEQILNLLEFIFDLF